MPSREHGLTPSEYAAIWNGTILYLSKRDLAQAEFVGTLYLKYAAIALLRNVDMRRDREGRHRPVHGSRFSGFVSGLIRRPSRARLVQRMDAVWPDEDADDLPRQLCQILPMLANLRALRIGAVSGEEMIATAFRSLRLPQLEELYSDWPKLPNTFLANTNTLRKVRSSRGFIPDAGISGQNICPALESVGISSYDDAQLLLHDQRPEISSVDIFVRLAMQTVLRTVLRQCTGLKTLNFLVRGPLQPSVADRVPLENLSKISTIRLWALEPSEIESRHWGELGWFWDSLVHLFPRVEVLEVDCLGCEHSPTTLADVQDVGRQLTSLLLPSLQRKRYAFRCLSYLRFGRSVVLRRFEGRGFVEQRGNETTHVDRWPDLHDGWA